MQCLNCESASEVTLVFSPEEAKALGHALRAPPFEDVVARILRSGIFDANRRHGFVTLRDAARRQARTSEERAQRQAAIDALLALAVPDGHLEPGISVEAARRLAGLARCGE